MVSATILILDEFADEFDNAKKVPIFTMQENVQNEKEAENNFIFFLESFGIEHYEEFKTTRLK